MFSNKTPSDIFKEEADPTKSPVDFKPTFKGKSPAEVFKATTPDCIYGYKSPVDVYIGEMITDMQEKRDGEIVAQIEEQIGVNVNKDELMKALAYDRNQYEAGYREGYARGFEGRRTVPVKVTNANGHTWDGYYDPNRCLLFLSTITEELAKEIGVTWEENEEQRRREDDDT